MSSIRDTVRAASDRDSEIVDVPEWGVKLALRPPSGAVRAKLLTQTIDPQTGTANEDWPILWPLALIACAYDPDTAEQAFEWGDLSWLQDEKSGAVLARLGDRCIELCGMRPGVIDDAKKDSSPTSSGDGISVSPNDSIAPSESFSTESTPTS